MGEQCSKCRRGKGMFSRIICGHALCRDCIKRIVREESTWYHECEGEYGKCKYRLPLTILKKILEPKEIKEQPSTPDKCRDSTDHYYKADEGTYAFLVENCNGRGKSNLVKFRIPYDPPKLTLKQEQFPGLSKLEADIYSKWPLIKTTWLHNGQTINLKEKEINPTRKERYHFSLTIQLNTFQKEVKGFYKCAASSLAGEDESEEIYVNLNEEPPVVYLKKTVNKHEQSVTFCAKIKSGNLRKSVTWMKSGEVLDISDTNKYFSCNFLYDSPELKIYSVEKKDEGEYYLIAENDGGKGESNIVPFQIETDCDRPKIKLNERKKDIISINLAADIESDWPITSVKWFKDGALLKISDRYSETVYGRYLGRNHSALAKLRIFDLSEVGDYHVCAENVAGISTSNVLRLNFEVQSFATLDMKIFPAHERVKLQGRIESSQILTDVTWVKNGKILPVKNSKKYASYPETENCPTLVIMDVCKEDEGNYYFTAKSRKADVKSNYRTFEIEKEDPKVTIQNPIRDGQFTTLYAIIEKTRWPIKSLIWKKDDTVVYKEEKYVNANEICTGRIRLSGVKDAGIYKVVAESIAGRSEAERIVLQEEIGIPVYPILKIEVDKCHRNLRLNVTSSSKAEINDCVWMKNEKILLTKLDARYQQSVIKDNKFELVIKNVTKRDEGEYKVNVISKLGAVESRGAVFKIEEEPPRIVDFTKREENSRVKILAVFESEWPVDCVVWYKNGEELVPSQDFSMQNDSQNCSLLLKGPYKRGSYTVQLESVAGIVRGQDIIINDKEINIENVTASPSALVKSTESMLLPVLSPFKGSSDCDSCDYTAMAKIKSCGHYLCWKCLEVLADGPSKENIVDCLSSCPSWMTQKTIQNFLHNQEYSKKQISLYFKLVAEGENCNTLKCLKKGFLKLVFCSHVYCVNCIQNNDGSNMCVQNGWNCQNPPPSIFVHLQEMLKNPMVNLFISECPDGKCDHCSKKDVYKIFRCGHKFCRHCIQKALLPDREGQPFILGKCLKAQCHEYFKFPLLTQIKQETEPTNNCKVTENGTTRQGIAQESINNALPDHDKKDIQENPQSLSSQKRKQKNKDDSAKKQKKAKNSRDSATEESNRFQKSFGLSNVGLSCYRNAILQTLAETPFFHLMLEPLREKAPWIGLLSIILEKIRTQNTGGTEMVEYLQHFHFEFNEKHSEYREFQQEDTLSFLTSLLNGIQEEFKTLEKCKDHIEGLQDPTSLFRGSLKDRYFCKKCKEDEFFEGESYFSLPLPVTESLRQKGKVTLGSCLRGFLSKENIDGIPCSFCGSNEITKEIMIATFPDVLVLQICKLEEASNSAFLRNRSHIDFWENFESLRAPKELKEALKHYRLFSVVEHIGSERSGHYICYVRRHGNQKWNLCDDSYVKDVSLEEVRKCEAYLLFYEKYGSKV
ncbi:titin-like isoform X2 [Saccostrea cucullata]|uniref:titin-like isoform X2 n=1 Tax=Saccostrea cuccullata TaxID=36930 RepID=UPI002ECFE17C